MNRETNMDELKIRISTNENWNNSFKKATKNANDMSNWEDKDFSEYILGKGIGSVGQSYFQGDGKKKVIEWLKKDGQEIIKSLNKEKRFKTYENFQNGVIKAGGRNCWMAVHAMVVALQPDILCNVLSEDKLDSLYTLLQDVSSEEHETSTEDEISTGKTITLNFDEGWKTLEGEWKEALGHKKENLSWYYKSAAILKYFKGCTRNPEEWNPDIPWQVLMSLTSDERIKTIAKRLQQQKNIILTGAPGTGKTYMAQKVANLIAKDKKRIDFVQFHPSYDYSDFVEGLRPIMNGKDISFKRMDGKFKAFCAKAANDNDQDHKYVFIIDEINRGEISKIFGELFFAIDPGYRDGGKSKTYVKTQYHQIIEQAMDDESNSQDYPFKDGFYVPSNVYIIGTMNDIDRSVDSMDFAFRRRFAFIEISAEDSESIINNSDIDDEKKQELINKMESLNKAIVNPSKGGLTSAYQIGGAYFTKIKDVNNSYDRLWNEYLKGTLVEYYRGNPQQQDILKKLKEAFDCKGE